MKRMDDGASGVCCRAVSRLAWESAYIPLRFLPAGPMLAQSRLAQALAGETGRWVVVVADTGEIDRGAAAWIMTLYALRRWHPLAMRLATPTWRPWVERAIDFIGRNRYRMSGLMGWNADAAVLAGVRARRRARQNLAPACAEDQATIRFPATPTSPACSRPADGSGRNGSWMRRGRGNRRTEDAGPCGGSS